jgi:hypothetical protein
LVRREIDYFLGTGSSFPVTFPGAVFARQGKTGLCVPPAVVVGNCILTAVRQFFDSVFLGLSLLVVEASVTGDDAFLGLAEQNAAPLSGRRLRVIDTGIVLHGVASAVPERNATQGILPAEVVLDDVVNVSPLSPRPPIPFSLLPMNLLFLTLARVTQAQK